MENQEQPGMNPLKKYFRQPKLYVKLPSSGNFIPREHWNLHKTWSFQCMQ